MNIDLHEKVVADDRRCSSRRKGREGEKSDLMNVDRCWGIVANPKSSRRILLEEVKKCLKGHNALRENRGKGYLE